MNVRVILILVVLFAKNARGKIHFRAGDESDSLENEMDNNTDVITNASKINILSDIPPEKTPFLVGVESREIYCAGVLLSEVFVLTIASCVYGSQMAKIHLGYSESPRFKSEDPELVQVIDSSEIIIHYDYSDESPPVNNIALIKLLTPVMLNDRVQPGALVSKQEAELIEGNHVSVNGWVDSLHINTKTAPMVIRTKDTCIYLFGKNFLEQDLCGRWLSPTHFHLRGNAVTTEDKIVGLQSYTLSCIISDLKCTKNDNVLNLAPYLNWIAAEMAISVNKLTTPKQNRRDYEEDISVKKDVKELQNAFGKISSMMVENERKSKKFQEDISSVKDNLGTSITYFKEMTTAHHLFVSSVNETMNEIVNEYKNITSVTVPRPKEDFYVTNEPKNDFVPHDSSNFVNNILAQFNNMSNIVTSKVSDQKITLNV